MTHHCRENIRSPLSHLAASWDLRVLLVFQGIGINIGLSDATLEKVLEMIYFGSQIRITPDKNFVYRA
jgi:hypothetical protein